MTAMKDGGLDYVFEQFRVERGCLGYAIADPESREVAFVDPETEMLEPMLDFALKHDLKPIYIVDTHTHADHFSGAPTLRDETNSKLVMHEDAPCSSVDVYVSDGDSLEVGNVEMKFVHAPGHAGDLICVILPGRILTADALLIGSCGRTDLPNGDPKQQYHTLYRVLYALPDEMFVYPGHDYAGKSRSTIGREKEENSKLGFASEEEFIGYMTTENPRELDPVYQLTEALESNAR